MAYDPVKAHEYYLKYRKKGLKKGRKKGRKTASTKQKQTSLVGLSTAGLNDAGKMNWAMTKKDLQTEMNAALAKATTEEQKAEIRADYQGKALQALQRMKKDPAFAQGKKASAKGSSAKGSSAKGSSSKGKSDSSESKDKKDKKEKKKKKPYSTKKSIVLKSNTGTKSGSAGGSSSKSTTSKGLTEAQKAQRQALVNQANSLMQDVQSKIKNMSEADKKEAKKALKSTLDALRKRISKI